jgi:hypothetical protein
LVVQLSIKMDESKQATTKFHDMSDLLFSIKDSITDQKFKELYDTLNIIRNETLYNELYNIEFLELSTKMDEDDLNYTYVYKQRICKLKKSLLDMVGEESLERGIAIRFSPGNNTCGCGSSWDYIGTSKYNESRRVYMIKYILINITQVTK